MITEKINQDFKNYLVQIGYSKGSVSMLPRCTKEFLQYHTITAPQAITPQHIEQFYQWLQIRPNKIKAGGLSEIMIHHFVYSLRVFFNWLEETGQIKTNPISAMKFKRPHFNAREPLQPEEITKLFENCITAKETAILHLFYSCGIRRSEAQSLNINDIHFKQQLVYIREGKGAKRRVIPMTAKVAAALENYYLSERIQVKAHHDQEAFILNRVGQRMRGNTYNKKLKSILQRAGITRDISLHYLRHSIATHLLGSGLSIEYVRDFLGHSHLESTQVYAKVYKHQLKKL